MLEGFSDSFGAWICLELCKPQWLCVVCECHPVRFWAGFSILLYGFPLPLLCRWSVCYLCAEDALSRIDLQKANFCLVCGELCFTTAVANADAAAATPPHPAAPAKVQSVEDFVPDDSLDHSFLEDSAPQKDKGKPQTKHHVDSER